MGQKANPISLRLQLTNRHFDSCWYSNYFYKNLMTRELFLQSYLDHFLKSLKLPGGRHSVQYFQKKTQMSSFFCYPKSTRQSRFKMYGLPKTESFLKKNRFFFKARTDKKMKGNFPNFRNSQQKSKMGPFYSSKRRSRSPFYSFYSTKNQQQLYKIQRKLTSFQNFKLWSTFWSPHTLKKGNYVNGTFSPLFFSCIFSTKKINQYDFNQKNARNVLKMQFQGVSRGIPSMIHIEKKQLSQQAPARGLASPVLGKSKTSLDVLAAHFLDRTSKSVEGQFLQNLYLYHVLKKSWKKKKTEEFQFQLPSVNLSGSSTDLHFFREKMHERSSTPLHFFAEKVHERTLRGPLDQARARIPRQTANNTPFIKRGVNSPFLNGEIELGETKRAYSIQSFSPLETSCKNYLESQLSRFYGIEMHLIPFRVGHDWQCAHYLADEIVSLLQKRVPFRRLKTKLFKQFSQIPEIRGVRITCSGRVGGKSKKAQRAKTECMKYGETSLQVLDSKIDFSKKTAFTAFGSVGVKVWVCYN